MPLPGRDIGKYVPFDKPVPVPPTSPDDPGSTWVVCFNADWLPWVLGAITSLARAETYAAANEAEMIEVVERGYTLLAMFMDGCAVADGGQTILRKEPNNCGIEWSTDAGLSWHTIDLVDCINSVVQIGIQDAILDGLLGQGSGPLQPLQPPAHGVCVTRHIQLWGGRIYTLTQPVSAGDTINVSNVTGSMWSITGLVEWGCWDGRTFAFGDCVGDRLAAMAGDKYADIHHLALVVNVGSHHYEAANGLITVPNDIENVYVSFEANGDTTPLLYNGDYAFDVEICTSGWRHSFNFTNSDLGWIPYTDEQYGGRTWAQYEAGGWVQLSENTNGPIIMSPVVSTHVTHIEIRLAALADTDNPTGFFSLDDGSASTTDSGAKTLYEVDVDWTFVNKRVRVGAGNASNSQITADKIVEVVITGTGDDPF